MGGEDEAETGWAGGKDGGRGGGHGGVNTGATYHINNISIPYQQHINNIFFFEMLLIWYGMVVRANRGKANERR